MNCPVCNLVIDYDSAPVWATETDPIHLHCADAIVSVVMDLANSESPMIQKVTASIFEMARMHLLQTGDVKVS